MNGVVLITLIFVCVGEFRFVREIDGCTVGPVPSLSQIDQLKTPH